MREKTRLWGQGPQEQVHRAGGRQPEPEPGVPEAPRWGLHGWLRLSAERVVAPWGGGRSCHGSELVPC